MNASECNEIFQKIEDNLEILGLKWIAEQTKNRVELGKDNEKKLKGSGKRGNVIESKSYTPQESLKLLIDNIQKFVSDSLLIEQELIKFFYLSENHQNLNKLAFYTDDSNENEVFSITKTNIDSRLKHMDILNELLAELKQDIQDN